MKLIPLEEVPHTPVETEMPTKERRLRRLIHILENDVTDWRYSHWLLFTSSWFTNSCNTPACALGHARRDHGFQEEGILGDSAGSTLYHSAVFFGVPAAEGLSPFWFDVYGTIIPTRARVIEELKKYLPEKKTVIDFEHIRERACATVDKYRKGEAIPAAGMVG